MREIYKYKVSILVWKGNQGIAKGGPKRIADHNSREIGRNYNISLQERNELVKLAERYLGYHSLFVWNANINGIIIQLRTNDTHLDDFWRENWFPAAYDHNLRPHGVIYAVSGISDTESWVYYNSETKTGIVFNADSYERIEYLEGFEGLDPAIVKSMKS